MFSNGRDLHDHLSILPVLLILALLPYPPFSPVFLLCFGQVSASDRKLLNTLPSFFFFLAASVFSCSKGSLLQLVNFSLVVTPGLSCPSACGILVPQPGIEPASSALQGGFLTTGSPGKSQHRFPLEALGFSLRTTTPAQPIYLVDCLLPRGPAKSHPTVITEILPSKGPEVN